MTSQKGSAHVLVIIGLIALLTGSLIYNFWQHSNKTNERIDKKETTSSQNQPQQESNSAETYKGKYTSGGNFLVKIPNGWTAKVGPFDGYEMENSHVVLLAGPNELEKLEYDEADSPNISQLPGFGWDGLVESFYIISQQNDSIGSDFSTSSFKLSDGSSGTKYTRSFTNEAQSEFSTFTKEADRYIAEIYEIEKGDTRVRAFLNRYSNSDFDMELAKKVIMSIKIN